MPRVRYFYCNTCERIYRDIDLEMHCDICNNYEEVSQEEYINQEDIQT